MRGERFVSCEIRRVRDRYVWNEEEFLFLNLWKLPPELLKLELPLQKLLETDLLGKSMFGNTSLLLDLQ
jgi:hypothetical protein